MKAYGICLYLLISTLSILVDHVTCLEEQRQLERPEKSEKPKVQVTRTALNVARSLDPDAMETLTVKTKTGDVATLLVKKREGRVHHFPRQNHTNNSFHEPEMIPIASSTNEQPKVEDRNDSKRLPKLVPDPVFVRSTPVLVKGQKNDVFGKQGRSLLKLDSDGIPVVTGVRMPDDESDRQIWRNARVINGVLMPYDKTQSKQPYRNGSPSGTNDKRKVYVTYQNQGSWVKMETVQDPSKITSDPIPTQYTQPVQATAPTPTTYANQWQAPKVPEAQNVVAVVGAPTVQEWHQYPQEVVKVIDDRQPTLKEEDKYLRDKILEYIKSVNQQELNRHQQMRLPSFRDAKMLDQPIEVESRLLNQPSIIDSLTNYGRPVEIQTTEFVHEPSRGPRHLGHLDVEARMINQPLDTRNFGPPIEIQSRNMEPIPMETQNYGPIEMEARMLQIPGASAYPASVLYSPPSAQPDSRGVSVEEGMRTPVLQYAHPELGVQVAEVESTFRAVDDIPNDNAREQAVAYFAHDIHADRSPFAFEPGFEYDEAKVNENSQRSNGDVAPQVKPKHVSSNFIAPQSVGGDPGKYYGKFEAQQVQYGGKYERPFWERIGDTIREHVQTGMDRMSEMTRPVMEPLVEATHKISHNLGLGSNRELTTLKERLGVVSTPSVILPALGLVAGGAALGLGAVAVGRYLDVDMLKRSGGVAERIGEDQLEMEHKRALSAIAGLPIGYAAANHGVNESVAPPTVATHREATPTATNPRAKRDLLQNFDSTRNSLSSVLGGTTNSHLTGSSLWSNTPCAKKTFCNAMLSQTIDDVIVMEKKMATYLAMLSPSSRAAIGLHLDDVMTAVNNRDCSAFRCRHDLSDIPVPR